MLKVMASLYATALTPAVLESALLADMQTTHVGFQRPWAPYTMFISSRCLTNLKLTLTNPPPLLRTAPQS